MKKLTMGAERENIPSVIDFVNKNADQHRH